MDKPLQQYTMLIVQRFGVRIFGAFLPLPFFPLAIAAAAAYATTGAGWGSLRRRTRRGAHGSRAQTVGLLGDGTHAQAMAPALGARRRQVARGNRFVKGQVLGSSGVNTRSGGVLRPPRRSRKGRGTAALKNNSGAASQSTSASQSGSLARGVTACSRSAIHRCGRRISRGRRAATQIAPQRAA